MLNYTLAILENKIDKLLKIYLKASAITENKRKLIKALLGAMEFAFFIYSASPKVNHTIRVCRIIASTSKFLTQHSIDYDLKHQFFKYIHDNVLQQLEKNTMHVYREIESLYLLLALSALGREYWLPETVLAKYFLLDYDGENYSRKTDMNFFSITVLLSYIKNKKRYGKIRTFIERHVILKIDRRASYHFNDTESLITFLDLIVCPYVSTTTKQKMARMYNIDDEMLSQLQSANDYWFTAWDNKFDLAKSLDDKRSREVY